MQKPTFISYGWANQWIWKCGFSWNETRTILPWMLLGSDVTTICKWSYEFTLGDCNNCNSAD